MAWLVAYNEGFLDHLVYEKIPPTLRQLEESVLTAGLTLERKRDEWKRFDASVLGASIREKAA